MRVTTTVNGERREADDVWAGESLLYVLRERMGLPGSKNACEQGECGSCTVYLDGVPVCACLVAAGQAEGREIGTVEGSRDGDGGCTRSSRRSSRRAPCSAASALPGCWSRRTTCWPATRDPADAEIREALAGNLCRCTGYEKILDAVRLAAARLAATRPRGRAGMSTTVIEGCARRHHGRRAGPSTPSATSSSRATGSPRSARDPRPRPPGGGATDRGAGWSTAPAAWPRPGWSTPTTTSTSGSPAGSAVDADPVRAG